MDKKLITENLIGESFKELLLEHSFEKITIKMITDRAGIIRPTFYNHFQDKYEVLEWYFEKDVMGSINSLIDSGMEREAIKMIFIRLDRNRNFYRKALGVDGQNSFKEVLLEQFRNMYLHIISNRKLKDEVKIFNAQNLAGYYANGLLYFISAWLLEKHLASVDEIYEEYCYIISHSVQDYFLEENL